MIREAITSLISGQSLSMDESASVMEEIMQGDLDSLINEVKIADQAEQLKESELMKVDMQ